MSNALLKEIGRVKEIREAILAPYLNNTEDDDVIDYTCIMDSLGEMKYLSTQVLRDVVDEIVAEIESRVEPDLDDAA